jgi:hypothetical protein
MLQLFAFLQTIVLSAGMRRHRRKPSRLNEE